MYVRRGQPSYKVLALKTQIMSTDRQLANTLHVFFLFVATGTRNLSIVRGAVGIYITEESEVPRC